MLYKMGARLVGILLKLGKKGYDRINSCGYNKKQRLSLVL
jgi:hypothetical protein